jgi:kynurenine 3-monooxygenase
MGTQDETQRMTPLAAHISTDVVIIGAGLVGPFVAGMLAKRGYNVIVADYRPDPELGTYPDVRKLHLSLSTRGLTALHKHGLIEAIEKISVKMYGRRVHVSATQADYYPYSFKKSNCLYTLSRVDLNKVLVRYGKQFPNVQSLFKHRCQSVDVERKRVVLTDLETNATIVVEATVLIGADGVNSSVREAILSKTQAGMSVTLSPFGYKSLCLTPKERERLRLNPEEVHVWPHGSTMLLGLAGTGGEVSCALVMPMEGCKSFAAFSKKEAVETFFRDTYHFPEALTQSLADQFCSHPVGRLPVIECGKWYDEGTALLLGEAAQSTVPWYAQGVNKALQDCLLLEHLIDEKKRWQDIFPAFQQQAKPAADALARLSENNLDELREQVTDQLFAAKKQVEVVLSKLYPEQFRSTYELVAFSLVPFDVVEHMVAAQDQIIVDALNVEPDIEKLCFPDLMEKIRRVYERGDASRGTVLIGKLRGETQSSVWDDSLPMQQM